MESRIEIFAYVFLILGLALFAILLTRIMRRIFSRKGKTESEKLRNVKDFLLLSIGILSFVASAVMFWLGVNLEHHLIIGEGREIGIVELQGYNYDEGGYTFRYTPSIPDGTAPTFSFELDCEKWYVSAEIIDWPGWLGLLGLEDCCKIDGIYCETGTGYAPSPGKTSYEINGGQSKLLKVHKYFDGLFLGMRPQIVQTKVRNFGTDQKYKVYADSIGITLKMETE